MSNPNETVSHENLRRPTALRKWLIAIVVAAAGYGLATYIVVPQIWKRYGERHPQLEEIPEITYTGSGIPGDPLNVALIGSESDLKRLMIQAGWFPADPLTLKSCLEIATDSVLKRTYDDAPVSNLFLFGRKEDLAFEQPVGGSPRQRHHVRYWRSPATDADSRPVWVGSVTFDESVGLSHTTGQITHHISGDVDAERDRLMAELDRAGGITDQYAIPNFHKTLSGKNGGGDSWRTDGRLLVGVMRSIQAP